MHEPRSWIHHHESPLGPLQLSDSYTLLERESVAFSNPVTAKCDLLVATIKVCHFNLTISVNIPAALRELPLYSLLMSSATAGSVSMT